MKRMLGLVILRGETIVTLSVEGPPPAADDSKGSQLGAGPGVGAPAGRGMGLGAPTMFVAFTSCGTPSTRAADGNVMVAGEWHQWECHPLHQGCLAWFRQASLADLLPVSLAWRLHQGLPSASITLWAKELI